MLGWEIIGIGFSDFSGTQVSPHLGAPIEGQELTVLRLRGGGGIEKSDESEVESDDGASTSTNNWNSFIYGSSMPIVRGRNV
jgi:hypothetical protein